MDKKDLFAFFFELKNKYKDIEVINIFENYEIEKLDVQRMYRYLDKYITENAISEEIISILNTSAQAILDARNLYPNASLADLYDPLTMPIELVKAHYRVSIHSR